MKRTPYNNFLGIILVLALGLSLGGCVTGGYGQYPGSAWGPYSQSYALPTLGLTAAGAAIGYNVGDRDDRVQNAVIGGILGAVAGTVAEQAIYASQQEAGYYGQPAYQQPAYYGQQPAYYGQQPAYYGQQPVYYGQQPAYGQPVYYQQQDCYNYGPRHGRNAYKQCTVPYQQYYNGKPVRGVYGQRPGTYPY